MLLLTGSASAQKQLIILRNGKVKARFGEDQYIRLVLKKKHRHAEGHIVELYDSYMITSNDTIQFRDILKINIKKQRSKNFLNTLGGVSMALGVGYIGLDRLNNITGYNDTQIKQSVWLPSSILAAGGACLLFIRPRYRRINGVNFLQTIDYRSPFFQ